MHSLIQISFGLFFVISGALACNPGWNEFRGNCIQVSLFHSADVRMARRYCMVFGGDLAYINNSMSLHYLTFLPNIDLSEKTYWLKENSLVEDIVDHPDLPTTPSPNSCAYLDFQGIQYGDCEAKKKFICEVRKQETDLACPEKWHLFGSTCYKPMPMQGDYNQSIERCSGERGHLAVLDGLDKEHHSASVIIGQNKSFMIDATRDTNGTFKWSNGKDFQPSCVDCIQHSTEGDCLGFSSDSEHPMLFTWVQLNCSDQNYFLCEMDAFVAPTTATTITTSTPQPTSSTTLIPFQCPVGYNWKAHEETGFCYWETTYEADRLNWHQAREFCQAYGGDLATYQNEQQETHGLGGARGHYRGLWFGLERSPNDIFHWVDGTPWNYTNWDFSEPNLVSRSKFCGVHGSNNGKWELDYCGVRRWFVCKAPMVRRPTIPDLDFKKTRCNISSTSAYRHQWYLYKDHCYMVHEDPKYSWSMAQNFCNDNDAHLASIHSFAETDFILLLGSVSSTTDYWIGLSTAGRGYSRAWSDDTPVDFLYWGDDFTPTEQIAINSCVTFNKQRGYWQTEHCNRFLGVICKRGVNSSYEFSTPKPALVHPGNCEQGWYNLGNKCYKIIGEKWSQRLKWSDAKENCESVGASLASVHSEEEQDFLTDLLLSLGHDAWIGLQNLDRGNAFEWSDDTPLDFTNWNENEPALSADVEEDDLLLSLSMQMNSCIKLSYEIEAMGKWNDVKCSQSNAYICQKPKNPNITEPSKDLFVCSNITGWSKLGSSCYGFFDRTASWIEAQKTCRSFDANLVSFKSSAMGIFLKKRMSQKYQFFWTGIREMAESKYGLLNGRRLKYANWLAGQPRKVSTVMDNCVAMNLNTQWVVRSCKENFSFVCEWNPEDDMIDVIEKRHTCPNVSEWEDIGGDTCYIFSLDYKLSWDDAMLYCFRHGGTLASFHSSKEAALIQQHLSKNTEASFLHIGLGKRKDGSYGWVDHSPLDFVQWDEDEPRTYGEGCVQLFVRNGKWRNVGCDESMRGFICSSTRDTNKEALIIENNTEDVIGNKLAVGGIFGIAICVMVVLAIAGVTAYYLCPSTRMQVSLLESE